MQPKKIVVIGSCNTDMVVKTSRLPAPGETVTGGTFLMNAGGKGANQAVAASRLGAKVTLIAKTGNDVFGKQSAALFHAEGIDTAYIFSDESAASGVALITVDASGENCIAVAPGANAKLTPRDLEAAKDEIESADFILMQLEIPLETVQHAADMAGAKGIRVILNPAPAQILPDALLRKLYIITPNESEAEILSGLRVSGWDTARAAADIIAAKGVANVVITLGARGAFIKAGDSYHCVDAISVTATDTTAAGDSFTGALCVGLSEGKSILDAVRLACSVAAITVTRMGAQSSIPYRHELSPADHYSPKK